MALSLDAARLAIDAQCSRRLGLSISDTALGIVQIANSAMANALRLVSVQRGHDPRDLALVAFGGAGPLHANWLADELGFRRVIVPRSPGTFSAMGLLVTDLMHEYSRSLLERLDRVCADRAEGALRELEAEGAKQLQAEGISPVRIELRRSADLRYVGQSFELNIGLPAGRFDAQVAADLAEAYHREHERAYGFAAPHEPVELVNVRVSAVGMIDRPRYEQRPRGAAAGREALKGERPVCLSQADGYVPCQVWDRYRLGTGSTVAGPAIIEENDATTLVEAGSRATVDHMGNLVIRPAPA
jgi:N-methylhydantoinase A